MNLIEYQQKVKYILNKFENEIRSLEIKNQEIIHNFEINYDETTKELKISASFSSLYYQKLNQILSEALLPIRNKISKKLYSALPKEDRSENNQFYITMLSYTPFNKKKLPYICLLRNNLRDKISDFFDKHKCKYESILLNYSFVKDKNDKKGYVTKADFSLLVKNFECNENYIKADFKEFFKDIMKEIISAFVSYIIKSMHDLISKKRGMVQYIFFCNNEIVMIWSLMIDGHFKVKQLKKTEKENQNCKLYFSHFKNNYNVFLDIKLNGITDQENELKHLKEMQKIFVDEVKKIKTYYCGKDNQKNNCGIVEKIKNFFSKIIK